MSYSTSSTFKLVVPRGVQMTAAILIGVAVFSAVSWIFAAGFWDGRANVPENFAGLDKATILGLSSLIATFFAGWLVALGFVYGDAKRRGMRAPLWTLIVLLVPNLIGFLLYFALRTPLLASCGGCGGGIRGGQRFCSICGSEQVPSSAVAATATGQPVLAYAGENPPRPGLSLKSFSAGFAIWVGIFLSKSVFAFLKHDYVDSAVLLGFAAIGVVFLVLSHRKK